MDELRKSAMISWGVDIVGIGVFVFGIIMVIEYWWMFAIGILLLLGMFLAVLFAEIKRCKKC